MYSWGEGNESIYLYVYCIKKNLSETKVTCMMNIKYIYVEVICKMTIILLIYTVTFYQRVTADSVLCVPET